MNYYQLKSKEITVPGGQISYLHTGLKMRRRADQKVGPQIGLKPSLKTNEAPPFILIHGFTNSFRDWNEDFIRELGKASEIYMVNLKGIGHSRLTNEEHSIENYAAELIQFADVLHLESFYLLGHSMGGYIAQEIALSVPHRIKGLILSSTRMGGEFATYSPEWVGAQMSQQYTSFEEQDEAIAGVLAPDQARAKLAEIFRHRRSLGFDDNQASVETVEKQKKARVIWLEDFAQKAEQYARFTFPTLILSGEVDAIIPIENSYELIKKFPNSSLIKFPEGGHCLFHQFPLKVAAMIDFFKQMC